MATTRTAVALALLLAAASPASAQKGGGQGPRPPPPPPQRTDLMREVAEYMKDCMRSASPSPTAQEKAACRMGAKEVFANSTQNATDYSGGKQAAMFQKLQRGAVKDKANDLVRRCLEQGGQTRQAMQTCVANAKTKIGQDMETYMGSSGTAAQKTRKKTQMEKEAAREVIGEVFTRCLESQGRDQCKRALADRKAAAGISSEDTDSILRRHFAKTLRGVADNCTSGNMSECRAAAKQQAMAKGMKRREYAMAKRMGDVKAAAELWASCKETSATDAECEQMIQDEFVRVSGARPEDFDPATKEKVKKLGQAIKEGNPIVVVKFRRMLVSAFTTTAECTTVLEALFKAKALAAAQANNSNATNAIQRKCRVVDARAEYGAQVEADLPDNELEDLSDATEQALQGATFRRLQEAGVSEDIAADLARRLATVDEVYAAQDSTECVEGDTACTSGGTPAPTPAPGPSAVSGARRALAVGGFALAALAGAGSF